MASDDSRLPPSYKEAANDNTDPSSTGLSFKEHLPIEPDAPPHIDSTNGDALPDNETGRIRNHRRFFYGLRMCYIVVCVLDAVHWAYMLRDDSEASPNVWKFYGKICDHEHYYLILRIFLDAIVGFLGLGAAFWTKKAAFALPCAFVQPLLIFGRIFAWSFRNRHRLPANYRVEDIAYVAFEFIFPLMWLLLSTATMVSLTPKKKDKRHRIRSQPPLIVVSATRNENEDSFQFELNP